MDLKIHVKIRDFEFVETDINGTPQDARTAYNELTEAFKDTEFNKFLCELIDSNLTEWRDINYYVSLSPMEQNVMQSLKRFKKRIKNNKDTYIDDTNIIKK